MNPDVQAYHLKLDSTNLQICSFLEQHISSVLHEAESKVWHGHPVWFLNGNPIVGYSKEKKGLRLMFWSGADFEEPVLVVRGEKFKDASVFFKSVDEIDVASITSCLEKSRVIQWDYKNIVKRKGKLERIA